MRQPSSEDFKRFFEQKEWIFIQREFERWVEHLRDLLEDPTGMEGYTKEGEAATTARLRGSLEALRNIFVFCEDLTNSVQNLNKEKENGRNG